MREKYYKIGKDGSLFYGTMAQFEDCFGGVGKHESGVMNFARAQGETVEILLGDDGINLTELNFAHGLEGGGYSFEAPPEALDELGVVVWDDPDPDTMPWVKDGEFDYDDVLCPLYAFAPNTGHFAATEWPTRYVDGDSTYVLLTQGSLNETEHDCQCHGKLVPSKDTKAALTVQEILKLVDAGIEVPFDKLGENWRDKEVAWEYTGNTMDKPYPLCPHCEGDGYVSCIGGEWALYGMVPDNEFDTDEAEYVGNGRDGVYYQTQEYCGKYFVTAMVDSESGHFTEDILTNDGSYDTEQEANDVGLAAATDWCEENDVDTTEKGEDD